MELYQLGYFVELARSRNFTRAAERLRIAQPALSQQIRNLETELGARLFVRARRETLLTEAGKAFHSKAEALLALAEDAKQAVAEVAEVRRGRLVVATIPTVSAALLPDVITRYRRAHPGIELVLQEESSEGVADLVERGVAEIGFLQLPADDNRFEIRQVIRERFQVLCAARHPLARARTVSLIQLAREPFVLYKGRARSVVLEACRKAGFEPRIACETGEIETVRALVRAGLGVAILPQMALVAPMKSLVARPLVKPVLERRLGLIRRPEHDWSPAAQAFLAAFERTRSRRGTSIPL